MKVLAVDPGNVKSAFALYDSSANELLTFGKQSNANVRAYLVEASMFGLAEVLVIEFPRPRGQPMYYQLVDTIFWIGRFVEAYAERWEPCDRKDVKMCLCGNTKANDSQIRMAVINRFKGVLPIGGGKVPEIGNTKQQGPLYGVSRDIWQALAVAITYANGGCVTRFF